MSYSAQTFIDTSNSVMRCMHNLAIWAAASLTTRWHCILRSQGPKGLICNIYSHLLYATLKASPLEVRTNGKCSCPIFLTDWDEAFSSHLYASINRFNYIWFTSLTWPQSDYMQCIVYLPQIVWDVIVQMQICYLDMPSDSPILAKGYWYLV